MFKEAGALCQPETGGANEPATIEAFCISKHAALEAWKRVKANQGAAGVDEESISDFEHKLKDSFYRLWNRMSSGSYMPPPVRTVSIPKAGGGERRLGIPTVMDRVAQMVVKMQIGAGHRAALS